MSEESLRKDPIMEYMQRLEERDKEKVEIKTIEFSDGTKYKLPKPISVSDAISRDSTQLAIKLLCELLNMEKIEE